MADENGETLEYEDSYEYRRFVDEERQNASINSYLELKGDLLIRKNKVLNGAVGTKVKCPNCNTTFVKRRQGHCFCSNQRTHGSKNCKDQFHNRLKGIDYQISCREEAIDAINRGT